MLRHVQLIAAPWTVTCQASLFMELPRQEYLSGLLFPSPEDLPDPKIKPWSPALQTNSLPLSHQGSSMIKSLFKTIAFLANILKFTYSFLQGFLDMYRSSALGRMKMLWARYRLIQGSLHHCLLPGSYGNSHGQKLLGIGHDTRAWTVSSSALGFHHAQSLQSCPTLYDPIDSSQPGAYVNVILQARILGWVAMPSSRESSPPRDQTCVFCISCVADEFHWPWSKEEFNSQIISLSFEKKKIYFFPK